MTGIVLTYFQRYRQLMNTMESFKQYSPDDFFVVIVDDASPDKLVLGKYPFKIILLRFDTKEWTNPSPVYNYGFIEAISNGADSIIIQNAECYHRGDIIGYVKRNVTDNEYLAFGCYALGPGQDIDFTDFNMRTATHNGDSAWYNHSVYRPEGLHFCTALTTKSLKRINGFDERFAFGVGFDDNYFIHQVRCSGLKVRFIDNPYVLHQFHYDTPTYNFDTAKLYAANSEMYHSLRAKGEFRSKHIITPDL